MIDKEQLKELGWSEELINEITRISDHIESSVVDEISLEESSSSLSSESGNTINFTNTDVSTNSNIKLK